MVPLQPVDWRDYQDQLGWSPHFGVVRLCCIWYFGRRKWSEHVSDCNRFSNLYVHTLENKAFVFLTHFLKQLNTQQGQRVAFAFTLLVCFRFFSSKEKRGCLKRSLNRPFEASLFFLFSSLLVIFGYCREKSLLLFPFLTLFSLSDRWLPPIFSNCGQHK